MKGDHTNKKMILTATFYSIPILSFLLLSGCSGSSMDSHNVGYDPYIVHDTVHAVTGEEHKVLTILFSQKNGCGLCESLSISVR